MHTKSKNKKPIANFFEYTEIENNVITLLVHYLYEAFASSFSQAY